MALRLAAKLAGSGGGGGGAAARRIFSLRPAVFVAAAACGSAAAAYYGVRRRGNEAASVAAAAAASAATAVSPAASPAVAAAAASEPAARSSLNWRERLFLAHASLQYNGVAYLSPLDFLQSVALSPADGSSEAIKGRRRRVLAEAEYKAMIRATPSKRRASDHLFRDIGANGLISYPEFLLLLNVLSKSSSGFEIAFRAFDLNSDGQLDVDEFRRLYRVVSGSTAPADSVTGELLSYCTAGHQASTAAAPTSLLVHFFGSNCRDSVSAADFAHFADNLQREVLLVEFQWGCAGSGQTGATTMAPLDFGRAVLRRTRLSGAERRLRLGLLEDRVWKSDGVTAEEYRQFFQFLLHSDDLFFALRMFDIAGQSIDQDDFQRAVKAATGQSVSPKLLTIVFALLDIDGDGALSYGEFLNLFGQQDVALRDRSLALGQGNSESAWERYRKCVKRHMLLQQ